MASLVCEKSDPPTADDENSASDNDSEMNSLAATTTTTKSKKKKKKKKKSAAQKAATPNKPPHCRLLGTKQSPHFTNYYVSSDVGQTEPPTKRIFELEFSGKYPVGEIQDYTQEHNGFRKTSEEKVRVRVRRFCARLSKFIISRFTQQSQHKFQISKMAMDLLREDYFNTVREAAEVHRQVRSYAQSFIKPGIELAEMCRMLEDKNRELIGEKGLERGIGFPTGCSINHVAAHYTPNSGDKTVLEVSIED